MGSLSFGISEIVKTSVNGWFRLLNEDEGEFYNVPCPDDVSASISELRSKIRVYKKYWILQSSYN